MPRGTSDSKLQVAGSNTSHSLQKPLPEMETSGLSSDKFP